MTTIDLLAAVAAALETDNHYSECPLPPARCVACQVVRDRVERAVVAAAPVITQAVWQAKAEANGLQVWQQWGARRPGHTKVRQRDDEAQARALARQFGYELIVRDAYTGAGEWRTVADYSPAGTVRDA